VIRALLLAAVLAFGFSSNSFSQEKKAEKKTEKKTAKKKAAAPSQDWNRFNTGAKRDLEKIEKKDAKGKMDPKGKKDAKQP
jgi:hypothetical protein